MLTCFCAMLPQKGEKAHPGRAGREWALSSWPERRLDRRDALLAGADADHFLDIGDEDLAVSDAASARAVDDGFHGPLHHAILAHHLDFHLGQEVHDIFGAAILLGMALLPAESLSLGHGDALKANFMQGVLHFVQFERLDDRFDFFHLHIRPSTFGRSPLMWW